MPSRFTRLSSMLTVHLWQYRGRFISASIIKTAKSKKMERRISKTTSVPISDLYRDREQYHEKDRLDPQKGDRTPFGRDQDLNQKILINLGDITALRVDAIVNAANRSLLGGGGVDGRIHDVAGPQLLRECRTLNGCRTGFSKITDAYGLPCRKVIHAVGPIYHPDREEESAELLANCYKTSLAIAATSNLKTIAFSCLSTGAYGYPSKKAAEIALDTVREFLQDPNGQEIDQVIFCLFLRKDVETYLDSFPYFFPPTTEELFASTNTKDTQATEASSREEPDKQDGGE